MDSARQTTPHEVTRLLRAAAKGDEVALGRAVSLVYEDLRRRAASYLHQERTGHTLAPTALVHEAYLRLRDHDEIEWSDGGHLQAVLATCMCRVLTDHARRRNTDKRGGGASKVAIEASDAVSHEEPDRFLILTEALERLRTADPRKGRLAELRLFGGLEFKDIAKALDVSLSTVEKEWRLVRAWLLREATDGAR